MRNASAVAALGLCLLAVPPPHAEAQLRPLEPAPWAVFDAGTSLLARAGVSRLTDQRASLAGTSGTLHEIGDFSGAWRSGRMAVEIGGTLRRSFRDGSSFAPPLETVRDPGPRRSDSGDYRVGTLVRLTPVTSPALLLLRFGTRLPNSDDQVGLDRDRTDFYALLGGQLRRGHLRVGAEAGVGIHGAHDLEYEQADPLLYALDAEYGGGATALHLAYVGQRSGFGGWVQRGNESLSELRIGASAGSRFRLQLLYVRGLAEFSPGSGWILNGIARW